jgi:hypothetical protein
MQLAGMKTQRRCTKKNESNLSSKIYDSSPLISITWKFNYSHGMLFISCGVVVNEKIVEYYSNENSFPSNKVHSVPCEK